MEELLNKLIERGWKPFGSKNKVFKVMKTKHNWWYFDGGFGNEICFSLRELVSKESGLWQFVCDNELYNPNNRGYWGKNVTIVGEYPTLDGDENIGYKDYEYYLIESSLIDEDELENFLIENIKVS